MVLSFSPEPDNASPLIVIVTVTPATPLLANVTRPVIDPVLVFGLSCAETTVREIKSSAMNNVNRVGKFISPASGAHLLTPYEHLSSALFPSSQLTSDPLVYRYYVLRSCSPAPRPKPYVRGSTSCPSCIRARNRCSRKVLRAPFCA